MHITIIIIPSYREAWQTALKDIDRIKGINHQLLEMGKELQGYSYVYAFDKKKFIKLNMLFTMLLTTQFC